MTLEILRPLLAIGETSATYNQFSLPYSNSQIIRITICTFFKPNIDVSEGISIIGGDNSFRTFYHNLRKLLNTKKFDIIHVHSPHVSLILMLVCIINRISFSNAICTVHNSFSSYKIRNKLLFFPVFAFFPRLVTCSHSSYESFPKPYKFLAGKRISVIQNGLDIERIDKVLKNRVKKQRLNVFNIVVVGRLIQVKNPLGALLAFYKCTNHQENVYLTFIGEGELEDCLKKEVNRLGIENKVNFTGLIPRERVYLYLSSADLFISTSVGEGLPIAVLEAMACRCPIILSNIPPHKEITKGMDIIPLVDPDNVDEFSNNIQIYIDMQPHERMEIGEKCRKQVEVNFRLDTMLEKYVDIYHEMIDGK